MGRLIFITGTSTGVGKTVLTSLLLSQARRGGLRARGLKPFCSGERTDATILWELMEREVPLERVNPYYFTEPLAPWTAARASGREVGLGEVVQFVRGHQEEAELVLVEGAGGLLTPLGQGYSALDIIRRCEAEVVVVAANQLGVLNHTLLTVGALAPIEPRVVLMNLPTSDRSSGSNGEDLELLLGRKRVIQIPALPGWVTEAELVREHAVGLEPQLESILR